MQEIDLVIIEAREEMERSQQAERKSIQRVCSHSCVLLEAVVTVVFTEPSKKGSIQVF